MAAASVTNIEDAPGFKPVSPYPVNRDYTITLPNTLLDGRVWNKGCRPPSVNVMLVYQWLWDKTTSCKDAEGEVLGGRAISFGDIAASLFVDWCTVQRAVKWLKAQKMIRVKRNHGMSAYSYTVLNCTKYLKPKASKDKLRNVTRRTTPADASTGQSDVNEEKVVATSVIFNEYDDNEIV